MRTRLAALLVLVLALVVAIAWQWHAAHRPAPPPGPRAATGNAPDTLFPWRVVHSLADSRAMLRDAYRLAPDRRFLDAVTDVPLLAGARNAGRAEACWDGARWVVRCGADSVGTLPEFPSYAEARALLAPWAAHWASRTNAGAPPPPGPNAGGPGAVARDPLAALAALDVRWRGGERGAVVQADAGEALAWLVFADVSDPTRQSDLLGGRALAALALADAGHAPTARGHVLLSRLFGYAREAGALAAALPAEDPARAWALDDTAALGALAGVSRDGFEARLLRLSALAHHGRLEEWSAALARDFPASRAGYRQALATGLSLQRFESAIEVAVRDVYETALETQRWSRVDTAAVRRALWSTELVPALERLVVAGAPRAGGPLLDATVARAHVRAQVYAALTLYGEHERAALVDRDGARAFAAAMGHPRDGIAADFVGWYRDLVEHFWPTGGPPAPLAADLVERTTLGPELLALTYEALARRPGPDLPRLTRALLRRMDTRPRDIAWLASTSIAHAIRLEGWDALLAANAAAGGEDGGWAALWRAAVAGDDAELVRGMADPGGPVAAKARVLGLLSGRNTPLERLSRCATAACGAQPQEEWLALQWAAGLEAHDRPEEARRMLERWLDREWRDRPALGTGSVLAEVGRLYTDAGLPERALGVLDADSSGKCVVLAQVSRALDALGREREAVDLAEAVAQRYSTGPESRGQLALLHLAHGRDSAAAAVLATTTDDPGFWRSNLGPELARLYRGRPAEALRAVAVMAKRFAQRREILANVAYAFRDAGDPATGFSIASRVTGGGLTRAFDVVAAYEMAIASVGPARALAWFDTVGMGSSLTRQVACETGVALGHDELAWLDSLPSDPTEREWGLLVRAPGVARMRPGDPRRIGALREMHARAGGYYLALARYVAEGGEVDSVLCFADSPNHRTEVFYWVGRRAELEGRDADAAACYQLCRETAQTHQGEWFWADTRRARLLDPLHPPRERTLAPRERTFRPGPRRPGP